MLRRRPRVTVQSWMRHPAAGWLSLGVLYLTATVVNVLLALSMTAWWPAMLAVVMAFVTVLCAVIAWRRF